MRQLTLTDKELKSIESLYKISPNATVRERCFCILLSNKGHSMAEVSKIVGVHWLTVKRLFDKCETIGFDPELTALYSAKGQGAKVKLKSVAEILPDLIEKYSRNLYPILDILEKEHSIKVCKLTLQNFLKDAGL